MVIKCHLETPLHNSQDILFFYNHTLAKLDEEINYDESRCGLCATSEFIKCIF